MDRIQEKRELHLVLADDRAVREVKQAVLSPAEALGQVATHIEGIGAVEARHPVSRIARLAAEVAGRVDPHRPDPFLLVFAGHALRFEQWLFAEKTDVAAAVAD